MVIKTIMKTSLFLGALAVIFIVSCRSGEERVEKTIYLKTYERFKPDKSKRDLYLTLLKIYPAERQCISGFEHYANLYVANFKGQKLYVFEDCKKVADEAYDTTNRYPPLIDTNDILKKKQDSVVIFVPKDFSIPVGAKYLIAPLSFLVES
jgi:hypothetical protein